MVNRAPEDYGTSARGPTELHVAVVMPPPRGAPFAHRWGPVRAVHVAVHLQEQLVSHRYLALVGARAEDAGEVKYHEDRDEDDDDHGHQQAALPALGLRIVVVFGEGWHLGSLGVQVTSRRVALIDPATPATAA